MKSHLIPSGTPMSHRPLSTLSSVTVGSEQASDKAEVILLPSEWNLFGTSNTRSVSGRQVSWASDPQFWVCCSLSLPLLFSCPQTTKPLQKRELYPMNMAWLGV